MTDEPTLCIRCAHLHGEARRDPYYRWMCVAAPRELEFSFVTGRPEGWSYRFCRDMNSGDCPRYKAGPNCMSDDKLVQTSTGVWEKRA